MIRIETDRLILRNFTPEDWKDLAELGIKYEETELAKFDEGPWPSDIEEYKNIVKQMSERDDFLAVLLKENKKFIGLIFKGDSAEGKYEFGYNFLADYQGKGYATESCKATLDYIFEVLNAEDVIAGTAKINTKSCQLLERLGFKFVREKNISFRKDEKGNPIEFVGVDYILSRKKN